MARTDTHRPSVINPAEYVFVACDYYGSNAPEFFNDRKEFHAHMARTGAKFAEHQNSGSCHICGARAAYVAKFHHLPSNTYITTGMDCAEKMEIGDARLFASFRKRIKAGLKVVRGKLKAQQVLADAGLSRCWDIYDIGERTEYSMQRAEQIIYSIVGKLVQYGSLSDAQSELLRKLVQIDERAVTEAKRAAETADAKPVPQTDKRVTVRGEILSKRTDETQFGLVTKILLKHADGYKLWGSLPSGLDNSEKGTVVQFDARIQRSDKDDKFGFFSRPTKAIVVTG